VASAPPRCDYGLLAQAQVSLPSPEEEGKVIDEELKLSGGVHTRLLAQTLRPVPQGWDGCPDRIPRKTHTVR
jgi:hypothetical protein